MADKKAERIQTSILNGAEKKALVWLSGKMPKWVTSDMLTFVGTIGAIVIGLGYWLTDKSMGFLWLASLGFVINWFGDSLDGTLARERKTQRPIYGYYIDHTMDVINEGFMFLGLGLSALMRMDLAIMIFAVYLALTVNVSINAHLKSEFKLTYASLGPTEFRVIAIILNTVFFFCPSIQGISVNWTVFGHPIALKALDLAGLAILLVLTVIYLVTVAGDLKGYAKVDPPKSSDKQ